MCRFCVERIDSNNIRLEVDGSIPDLINMFVSACYAHEELLRVMGAAYFGAKYEGEKSNEHRTIN